MTTHDRPALPEQTRRPTRPCDPRGERAVPRLLALALLRQLPRRPDPADAGDDRPDLPVPLRARAAAARRPHEGRPGRRARVSSSPTCPSRAWSSRPTPTPRSSRWPSRARPSAARSSRSSPRTGETRDVFVDPYRLEVLGSLDPDTHAVRLRGPAPRRPDDRQEGRPADRAGRVLGHRHGADRLLPVRRAAAGPAAGPGRPGGQGAALRSRHALVGSVVGVGLLYLVVSGLPWTGFWGEKVQAFATERGSSMWSLDHGAASDPASSLDESLPHSHATDVPVGARRLRGPVLGPGAVRRGAQRGQRRHGRPRRRAGGPAAPDDRRAARRPAEDTAGVYSVIGYAFDAPSDEKTVHVDRYGGQVVSTYGFDDYPTAGQGGVPGHRPARGPQPGPLVLLGLRADVPRRSSSCASPAR